MAGKRLLICLSALVAAVILPSTALAAEQPPAAGGVHFAGADEVASPDAEPAEPLDGASGAEGVRPRVVGGQETTVGAYPWQVAVAVRPPPGVVASGGQVCGGTLVAPTIVITAAHCVHDSATNAFVPADAFSVIAGRSNLATLDGVELPVVNYYIAVNAAGTPLFSEPAFRWDVAVIEVSGRLPGTPIQIAAPDERASWAAGQPAFVSGWGSLLSPDDGPFPAQLHAAQVSIIDDADCGSPDSYWSSFQPDVMLCAGAWAGGLAACTGDSGGPLVVRLADGAVRLVGDPSFGPAGVCGAPRLPTVFGRLADDPMRSFLRQTVLNLVGRDIVGPAPPPDPVPEPLTAQQALELASAYSKSECQRWRLCRRHSARECTAQGDAYKCTVENRGRTRRGRKVTCGQTLLFTGPSADVVQEELTQWKCSRRR